jgi:hypothetical protein
MIIFWKFFNYKSFLANFFQINREFATVYFSFKLFFTKWRKLATKSKSLTRMFWKLTSKCMCRILGNLHVMHVLMNVMQLSANSHVMYGMLSITLTHTIALFLLYFPPLYSIFNWNFMHAKEQDMHTLISMQNLVFNSQ